MKVQSVTNNYTNFNGHWYSSGLSKQQKSFVSKISSQLDEKLKGKDCLIILSGNAKYDLNCIHSIYDEEPKYINLITKIESAPYYRPTAQDITTPETTAHQFLDKVENLINEHEKSPVYLAQKQREKTLSYKIKKILHLI